MSGWAKVSATVLALLTLVACSNGDDASFETPTVVLQEITVSPQEQTIPLGTEAQFSAQGLFSDGSSEDITESVDWSSSDVAVASVDVSGVVLGVGLGNTQIAATQSGISSETSLTVAEPELTEIGIFPPQASLKVGNTQDYRAFALFSDGQIENITFSEEAEWTLVNESGVLAPYDTEQPPTGELDDFGTAIAVEIGADELRLKFRQLTALSDVDVADVPLVSLGIFPRSEKVLLGGTIQYEAIGNYIDGTSADLTKVVSWSTDDSSVLSISGLAPDYGLARAEGVGTTNINASFAGFSDTTDAQVVDDSGGGGPIMRIDVLPARQQLPVGGVQQYQAIAYRDNGDAFDVTEDASWLSTDLNIAVVGDEAGDKGFARARSAGVTNITADFIGHQGGAELIVLDAPGVELREIVVTPANISLLSLSQQQYSATGIYSDQSSRNITEEVIWSSADDEVIQLSNDDFFGRGLSLALSPGQTQVIATMGFGITEVSGSTPVTVVEREQIPLTLVVTPPGAVVLVGDGQQYLAELRFEDGQSLDVTSNVSWLVSDPVVARIYGQGYAFGESEGVSEIIAELSLAGQVVRGTALIEVLEPTIGIQEIVVSPAIADILVADTQQFTATAILENGRQVELDSGVSWFSSNGAVATIGISGLAVGLEAGQTSIQANFSYEGETFSGTASLTVKAAPTVIESLVVSPPSASILIDDTQQFLATAILSDGTSVDVTERSTWVSSQPTVAAVDPGGLASALAAGVSTISATIMVGEDSWSDSATLTVSPPDVTILGLVVDPPQQSISIDTSTRFTATALLSNGNSRDVSQLVTWISSNEAIAHVDNIGLATGLGVGQSSIEATLAYNGQLFRDNGVLDVTAPALLEYRIQPIVAQVLIGGQQAYRATAVFDNGTSLDVTAETSWASSNSATASIDASGIAIGVSAGIVEIGGSIFYQGQPHTAAGTLEVVAEPVTIIKLIVDPSRGVVLVGESQVYTATVLLSDGSIVDVSSVVSWVSADPAIAHVDASGLATGMAEGVTDILARLNRGGEVYQDSGQIQVKAEAVVVEAIKVDPASETALVGDKVAYTATAILSDGTSLDVSNSVQWRSTQPAVASVNSQGRATAIASGTTDITALYLWGGDSFSDFGVLSVEETPLTVLELVVSPPSGSIIVGTGLAFAAHVRLSDGSNRDVTERVAWRSSNLAVAQVDEVGFALGVAAGAADIIASMEYEGSLFEDEGRLLVSAPPVTALELVVEPPLAEALIGDKVQYTATLVYSDESSDDVTNSVTWSSADDSVAQIVQNGRAVALAEGSSEIKASLRYQDELLEDTGTLTVLSPTVEIVALIIDPRLATILVGTTQQYSARVLLSDKTTVPVEADLLTWTTNASSIASVDNAGLATGQGRGVTTINASGEYQGVRYDAAAEIRVESAPAEVESFRIEPESLDLLVGSSENYRGIATLDNGSELNVTDAVGWASSESAIASISAGGIATAVSPGQVTITGIFSSDGTSFVDSGSLTVDEVPLTVDNLIVIPEINSVLVGATTAPYRAEAELSNGDIRDVSDSVVWQSSSPSVATIDSSGVAAGVSAGVTTIKAIYNYGDGQTARGTGELEVLAPPVTVESFDVSPTSATVIEGDFQQFTATATLSNSDVIDVTGDASWSVSDPVVAHVDANGGATGLMAGTSDVIATIKYSGDIFTDSGSLTVETYVPELVEVEIYPPVASIPLGTTQDYRAIALYEDGSLENVTFAAIWDLDTNPPILEAYEPGAKSRGLDDYGTALAIAEGIDLLTATYMGLRAETQVEVTAPTLLELSVNPASETVVAGITMQYMAVGLYSDGLYQDVTKVVSWQSSAPEVATISNEAGSRGLADALAEGETTITAALEGLTAEGHLRVKAPILQKIDVFPVGAVAEVGAIIDYRAIATYSDGSAPDVTEDAQWNTENIDDPAGAPVAEVDNSAGSKGQVTTLSAGDTRIIASFSGSSGSALLTVNQASVTGIRIEPAQALMISLSTEQFRAFAIFSDLTQREITNEVVWRSDDYSKVVVSNSDYFGRGLALAALPGGTSIRAEYTNQDDFVFDDAARVIIVVPDTDADLSVSPALADVLIEKSQQYTATLAVNGRPVNVTHYVTWRSDSPAAHVQPDTGLATGLEEGTATISATLSLSGGELTDFGTLTVKPPPVQIEEILVEPPQAEVIEGSTQAYSAFALTSDGDSVDISDDVDWSTGDSSIAQIDGNGIAIGLSAGDVKIVATLDYQGDIYQGGADLAVLLLVVPEALVITPPTAEIIVGNSQLYTAILRFSDMKELDVTNDVFWQSDDTNVATVLGNVAKGVGEGASTISATLELDGSIYSDTAALAVRDLRVDNVQVTPKRGELLAGATFQYNATAVMEDLTTRDVTQESIWFTRDEDIAKAGNGESAGLVTGIRDGDTLVYAEYTDNGLVIPCAGVSSCQATVAVAAPEVVEVQVLPPAAEILVGAAQQYQAFARLNNEEIIEVTTEVTWATSESSIAQISQSGKANGLAEGEVSITATYIGPSGNIVGTAALVVIRGSFTITDVVVEPVDATVLIDSQLQYTATALTSDNRAFDVTASSAWNSTSTAVAEVSAEGLVFAVAAGETQIQATYTHEDIPTTGSTNLVAEAPLTLIAVNVEPASAEVLVNASIGYTAWATFSDDSRENITTKAAWRSADTAVAVVGSGTDGGITTGVEAGTTQILADYVYQGQPFDCETAEGCAATVTVKNPVTIRAIQVTPANQEISLGNTEQYKAEAIFSDDSVQDITATAAWSSSEPDTLALEEPTGLFRGVSPGSAVVSATVVFDDQNVSGQTSATVLEALVIVERLVVEPVDGSVFVDNTLQYTATAYLSNDTHEDVTNDVTWSSDKQNIAVVSPQTGLARGRRAGVGSISAVWKDENGDITETVELKVIGVAADYLVIEPQDLISPVGYGIQYSAELHFSDGSSAPVTDNVIWSSSDRSVATIGNGGSRKGSARTLAVGDTSISARHAKSGVENSTGLEVTAALVTDLTIMPVAGLTLPVGTTESLTAQATYSDDTVDDVTDRTEWSTGNPQIATVSNAANGSPGGIVTGVQVGSTSATALFEGVSVSVPVDVTQVALESLDIKPESAQLQVGSTVAFIAEARFADGSMQIVTEDLTWQTDETSIAVISNDQGSEGVLTARAEGSTTVRAFYESQPVGDTPSVTVIPKQAIAVAVYYNRLPSRPSEINEINEDKELPIQFVAVATYADGLVEDVTNDALWSLERVDSGDGPDANINQAGQVTAEKKNEDGRSLDVVANFDGLIGKAELEISDICQYRKKDVRLVEMALVPGDSSMALSTQLRMFAQGYYQEPGGDKECVAPVLNDQDTDPRQALSWEVSSGSAVTVDDDGVIFAQECGVSVVTATKQKEEDDGMVDYQASATITVDCS